MRGNGQIVGEEATGLEEITDQPLPDTPEADQVREKVMDVLFRFRDLDASDEDQRLALEQLAGVLERLKTAGGLKRALKGKDESDLFKIANRYAIRHDNQDQLAEYGSAFREWIFHLYLAAIRLTFRVLEDAEPEGDGAG